MNKVFFLLLISLISVSVCAKNWKNGGDETLSVGLGIGAPSLIMAILENQEGSLNAKELNFIPNTPSKLKLSFQYGNLGFSVSKSNSLAPPLEGEIAVPIKSDASDFQCRFLGAKHGFTLYYQKYEGYYVENHEEFDKNLNNASPSILFPNLSTTHKGLAYTFNLKPDDFSLDAAFGIGDLQTKSSAGHFITASFDRHTITDPTSINPVFSGSEFNFLNSFKGGKFSSFAIGGGAGYNHVKDTFFASGLLMISGIAQSSTLIFGTVQEKEFQFTVKTSAALSIGYNNPQNKIALQLLGDTVSVPLRTGQIDFSSLSVDLLFVHRFDGIKIPFLQEVSSWFNL